MNKYVRTSDVRGEEVYNEFDHINGREREAKGRDSQKQAPVKELLGRAQEGNLCPHQPLRALL